MENIDWSPSFSVGVHSLDEQHKKIVEIINRLNSRTDIDVHGELISETLTVLTKYASDHFRDEERLLEAHGYPELSSQIGEHRQFQRTIVEFCQEAVTHQESVPQDLLTFLSEWWVHHILEEVMKYRSFFKARGVR